MLTVSILAFTIVVLLGGALAIQIMRHPAKPPPRVLAGLHGVAALLSYGVLLVALMGPARGAATGTQSFGLIAALLFLLAAAIGIAGLALHLRRRRMPGIAIGIHASVAIFGYVLLAVYLLAG
ncbi:MAG TPA: hypothetical protein VGP48_05285 [Stellaceae bacterium]|jgi:hypothetical protein|nr:hypothetical protein [Stellaceae bacterium]